MGRSPRPRAGKSGKSNLLGRSLDLLRDVSDRLQKEAERAWRLSGLRVEAATLRRKRVEALMRLGEEVQKRLQAGDLAPGELTTLSGRIAHLDRKLRHAERTIGKAEYVAAQRRSASEDKAPRQSQRLELVRESQPAAAEKPSGRRRRSADPAKASGASRRSAAATRPAPFPVPAARLPIDPLEDILGEAEDVPLEGLEDEPAAGDASRPKPRQK